MSLNSDMTSFFVGQYNSIKDFGGIFINEKFYEVKGKFIPNGSAAKECMIKIYNQFVKEGTMIPIEDLKKEEKESLVAECRLTGQQFTNETLTATSKLLHLIKTINDNT